MIYSCPNEITLLDDNCYESNAVKVITKKIM